MIRIVISWIHVRNLPLQFILTSTKDNMIFKFFLAEYSKSTRAVSQVEPWKDVQNYERREILKRSGWNF